MKKWIALLLALAMLFCLAACGGGDDADEKEDSSASDRDNDRDRDDAEEEDKDENKDEEEPTDEENPTDEEETSGQEPSDSEETSGAADDEGSSADEEEPVDEGESSGGITGGLSNDRPSGSDAGETTSGSVSSADEIVLVDNADCTMKITNIDPNGDWGYTLDVYLENKTDLNLYFNVSDAAINNVMCDPFWGAEVPAGKKVNETIDWDQDDLAYYDIEDVRVIDLAVSIYDNDNWDAEDLVNDIFTIYPQGDTADTLQLPARQAVDGEQLLIDNENCSFTALGYYIDDYWGFTLVGYLVNKTDSFVMFSMDDVSVNGYMCDPYWAQEVMPGKEAYAEIAWDIEDFENNGITDVESIEFTLRAYDNNDWSAGDFVNDVCTITFS